MPSSMSFPYQDLQPRTETNALRFVEDNPEYDGRNVSIGVLDTGIFPLAHGIAVEEGTGAPKLVHLIDCTGSGDVETVPAEALWVPSEKQDGGGRGSGSDDDNHCNGHWLVVSPVTGRNILLHKDWPIRPFPTSSEEEKSSIGQDSSESKSANDDRKDASGGEPSPSSAVAPNDDGSSPANTSPPTLESETKIAKATVPVRVGVKRAYELFPRSVRDRVKKERAKVMGRKLEPCVTALRSELARYAQSAPSLTPEQIKDRDNAKALLEVLTAVQTQLDDDPGPLYDVVVWYDGQDYCCVVNTADDGDDALVDSANSSGSIVSDSSTWDARSCEPLYSYSQRRQVLKCGAVDQMVMAVNLYDSGRLVSLVADVTPHGTHVAGIAAASEQGPRRSGVAPGAELVGLKIGDTRLGSMETGGALARAMREAVRLRCDVINLSYGEATSLPNAGYLIEMANELVYKHNIVFVSSVGNNGPALSTVGAPGGTTESILGVAAYVSPSMMRVDYSLPLGGDGVAATTDSGICSNDSDSGMVAENESKETVPSSVRVTDESEAHKGTTFTWSAVGPTVDGALGVDVTAPGGAITSVSHWCLQKSMLMNGTSMSSPHATGCVALLISACKGLGIPVSPSRIKRALMNTALALPKLSSVQQGAGMIQVDKALDYLVKFKDDPTEDINFAVSISDRLGEPRGVYLRQADETAKRHTYSIFVNPQFRREESVTEEIQQQKISFEMAFDIATDSPSWVSVPSNFMLMSNGRSFKIEVDPSQLPPGLHTANVFGRDATNQSRGPLFRLPITVVKPLQIQRVFDFGAIILQPAQVRRFFITPPAGSTWMDVTVKDTRPVTTSDGSSRLIVLHSVQILPHAAYRDFEKQRYISTLPSQTTVTSIAVEPEVTVEIDVARFWSTLGDTSLSVIVEFRGVRPVPSDLALTSGIGGTLVRLYSDLADETVCPTAKLTKWRTPLRPKAAGAVVRPILSDRDLSPSPNRRLYELILHYEFTQDDKGTFTPIAPALQGVLYEAAFECQLMLFFDGEKKYLGSSDAFPSAIKAPKGQVMIRLQARHDDPQKLEALKDLMIWIERGLEKEIVLSSYDSKEAMMSSDTFKKRLLRKGSIASVFIAHPGDSKVPSSCKPGDILHGTVTYESSEASLSGDGKRPGGFPVSLVVGPKPDKPPSDPEPKEPEDERTVDQKLSEAIRDLKILHLHKLSAKEKDEGHFDTLFNSLATEYPRHLPLLMTKLQHLDSKESKNLDKRSAEQLMQIIAAAESVISIIDQDSLSLHFGRKSDPDDPNAVKERKEMKELKTNLCDALAQRALAYKDLSTEDSLAKFDECIQSIKQWIDLDTSDRYAALALARDERAKRYGLVLQRIEKLLGNQKDSSKESIRPMTKSELQEKRVAIWKKLDYGVLVERDKRSQVVNCPKAYAPF